MKLRTPIALLLVGVVAVQAAPDDDQLLNLSGIPSAERTHVTSDYWPANPGEAAVCMWKDDKLAALSITIDDNCAMNVDWWLEQAASRKIPLTWFLVSGGIGGSNKTMNGTWDVWSRVRAAGHDIGSHTVSHLSASKNQETWKGIEWEYAESKRQIEAGIPDHTVGVLAYPGGGQSKYNDPKVASKIYLAARGTKGMPNGAQGLNYMSVNCMSKSNTGGGSEWANLNNVLDKSLYGGRQYGGWAVVLFHYVKAPYESPLEKFAFIEQHKDKLWVGTFGDVARYGQERETSRLAVKESTAARIVLSLADRMDDRYYNVPLTVKVHLPAGWSGVKAAQAGKPIPARVVQNAGASYALVDIVPDRGAAVVTEAR